MDVQQMIDALQEIEDKTMPVCIEEWGLSGVIATETKNLIFNPAIYGERVIIDAIN